MITDLKIKKQIADLIAQREDFIHSLNSSDYEEFYHSYNVFSYGEDDDTKVKIISQYDDGTTYERQFLIYEVENNILREATEDEDETLRHYDDEEFYIMEQDDTYFLIGRNEKDEVETFDDKPIKEAQK